MHTHAHTHTQAHTPGYLLLPKATCTYFLSSGRPHMRRSPVYPAHSRKHQPCFDSRVPSCSLLASRGCPVGSSELVSRTSLPLSSSRPAPPTAPPRWDARVRDLDSPWAPPSAACPTPSANPQASPSLKHALPGLSLARPPPWMVFPQISEGWI